MCAKWNREEYDPDLLASELQSLRVVDEVSKEVSFRGFLFEDVVAVVHSAIKFEKAIYEREQWIIVYRSVTSAAKAGNLTRQSLIAEISRREDEFDRRPYTKFVLTTSLSVSYFESLTKREISGHRLTFGLRLPERFRQEHEKGVQHLSA